MFEKDDKCNCSATHKIHLLSKIQLACKIVFVWLDSGSSFKHPNPISIVNNSLVLFPISGYPISFLFL